MQRVRELSLSLSIKKVNKNIYIYIYTYIYIYIYILLRIQVDYFRKIERLQGSGLCGSGESRPVASTHLVKGCSGNLRWNNQRKSRDNKHRKKRQGLRRKNLRHACDSRSKGIAKFRRTYKELRPQAIPMWRNDGAGMAHSRLCFRRTSLPRALKPFKLIQRQPSNTFFTAPFPSPGQ